ncbi:hypothetical protein BHM03_00027574 [Ensete ventricosum]|nr:hypothetical protein BHM03_00027574 [Ensete ventricosum]
MDYGIRQEEGEGGGGHRRRKRIPRRDPLGIRAVRERPTPTHGCPYLSPNLHPFPSNASKTRAPSHHRCIRILFYPRLTPSLPSPSSLCGFRQAGAGVGGDPPLPPPSTEEGGVEEKPEEEDKRNNKRKGIANVGLKRESRARRRLRR